MLPPATNEFQENEIYMHFCNACAMVAPLIPADDQGRHLNCPKSEFPHIIGTLKDTKADWLLYTDEQKQEVQDRVNARSKALQEFCLEGRAKKAAAVASGLVVRCPYCNSPNTHKYSTARKAFSLGFWMFFSRIQNCDYICYNCHRKW